MICSAKSEPARRFPMPGTSNARFVVRDPMSDSGYPPTPSDVPKAMSSAGKRKKWGWLHLIPNSKFQILGTILAICGTLISVVGTCVNNVFLWHEMAMWLWLVSNPMLLIWAYGHWKGYWNGGTSMQALMVMYAIFFVTGAWGLMHV